VDAYSGIPGGAGGGVNGYPSTGVPSVPGPYPLPVPMPYPVPAFGQPIAASTVIEKNMNMLCINANLERDLAGAG